MSLEFLVSIVEKSLLEAMKGDPNVEVLRTMVKSLGLIADLVPPLKLTPTILQNISSTLSICVIKSEIRCEERIQKADTYSLNEEEQGKADANQVKEEDLWWQIADTIGECVRGHAIAGFVETFLALVQIPETSTTSQFTNCSGKGFRATDRLTRRNRPSAYSLTL